MKNRASQVVWTQKLDLDLLSHHSLTPAWSDPLLLWKPLIYPSAKLEWVLFFVFCFKYTFVSKIEGIIFGREDLFSLSRYLYLERNSKAPKRQKIFSSETKLSRKQASLTTLVQGVRTNEQLFPEASFGLSGASFRFSCRCLARGGGSWASPSPGGQKGYRDWPRRYQETGGSSLRQT